MRIAIEISGLLAPPSGIRTYLERLIERYSKIDSKNEYLLYVARWKKVPDPASWLPPLGAGSVRPLVRRFPYRLLMELEHRFELRVQEAIFLPKIDVFHGACQVLPPLSKTAAVLTRHHFHDMRTHSGNWEEFYYKNVYEDSLKRAQIIITPSHFTKDFIVGHYGLDSSRVRVIYHGVFDPKPIVSEEKIAAVRAKYDLPKNYVLFLSRLIPSKGPLPLLKAFSRIAARFPEVGLVLAGGGEGDYPDEIRRTIAESGLESRVRMTGGVTGEDVPLLYAGASVFAFPSTSEGFGIPLVEAMGMGCPVIAARETSIPEVLGGAGVLFEGQDEEAIAEALAKVLGDSDFRKELIAKGLKRAGDFSWEKSAKEHLAVYRQLLS